MDEKSTNTDVVITAPPAPEFYPTDNVALKEETLISGAQKRDHRVRENLSWLFVVVVWVAGAVFLAFLIIWAAHKATCWRWLEPSEVADIGNLLSIAFGAVLAKYLAPYMSDKDDSDKKG